MNRTWWRTIWKPPSCPIPPRPNGGCCSFDRTIGSLRNNVFIGGASKFFIQLPFMLEGILAAAVGALLASLGLLVFVAGVIQGRVADAVVATQFVGVSDVLLLVPLLFAVAIVLAGVSSLITLERYLKV